MLFLDYLSTRPVFFILAGVFFIPLWLRIKLDIPNNKIVNIVNVLIVVIGISVTIPVYQANKPVQTHEEINTEERDYKECHMCGTKYYRDDDIGGNYTSIRKTNMCKKCYNSYKTVQEAVDHYELNK